MLTISLKSKKELKITEKNLKYIYGKDYKFFENKILLNSYSSQCKTLYTSIIVNYQIFLNDLNDIILRGFCKKCNGKVNRYLETGEVPDYLSRIKKLRNKKV